MTERNDDSLGPHAAQKTLVRRVAIGAVLGAIVFAGLAAYGDLDGMRAALAHLSAGTLLGALGLASGNYFLRYLRWQYYLRRLDVHVGHAQSALVFLSGFVMSLTPGKLGEVFKSLLLKEAHGVSIAKTAPVVFAERLTDLIALVVLVAWGATSFRRGLAVTLALGSLVGLLLLVTAHRPTAELALRLVARLPGLGRLEPKLRQAYDSLFVMTRPGPLAVATLLGVVAWSLEAAALHVVLVGMRIDSVSPTACAFAYASSTMAGALALMPGGLGVTEAGLTGLLQALGGPELTRSVATAATLVVRLATLWYAVAVGFAALAFWRTLLRRSGSPAPEAGADRPPG